MCGGGGPDVLRGDRGADLLIGGGGPDVASGGGESDNCTAEVAKCESAGGAASDVDLSLDIQVPGDSFFSPSSDNQYVYTVQNNTTQARTGRIVVTDTLPAGMTYESVSFPPGFFSWTCSVTSAAPPPGRETVSCQYGSELLFDDAAFTLRVDVDVPTTPVTVNDTACITFPVDSNPDNNCETVTTQIVAVPSPLGPTGP